jgi:hypothetical protein
MKVPDALFATKKYGVKSYPPHFIYGSQMSGTAASLGLVRHCPAMSMTNSSSLFYAEILEQSVGARKRVWIGLSYRPARLRRLAESIPWNLFHGLYKSLKIPSLVCFQGKVSFMPGVFLQ